MLGKYTQTKKNIEKHRKTLKKHRKTLKNTEKQNQLYHFLKKSSFYCKWLIGCMVTDDLKIELFTRKNYFLLLASLSDKPAVQIFIIYILPENM